MFDNIHTKYENAKDIIGIHNHCQIIEYLENEINNGNATAENYAYLSKAYMWPDNIDKSIYYAQKAIETDPYYSYGYFRMAYIYFQFEELNTLDSYIYLNKAMELAPDDYQNVALLTQVQYELREDESETFSKLLSLNNEKADYYYQLARVCRITDKIDEAIKYLHMAYEYSDKTTLYYRLADCYNRINKHKEALKYINISIKHNSVTDSHFLKGCILYDMDKYEKALVEFNKALEMGYKKYPLYLTIAYTYYMMKDDENTIKYFDLAEKTGEPDLSFYDAKCEYYLDNFEYDKAIETYKKLLEIDKRNTEAFHGIAYCYLLKKDYKEAIKWANKTILIDKNLGIAYMLKAQALGGINKMKEGIKIYKSVLEKDFEDTDRAYVLAQLSYYCAKTSEIKKAMDYANEAIMLNPNYAYAQQTKGFILMSANKFDEAIEYFEKAQELESDVINLTQIAECYRVKGLFRKAIEYANQTLLQDPKNGDAYFIKGNSLLAMGKTKAGELTLKKAEEYGGVFTEIT